MFIINRAVVTHISTRLIFETQTLFKSWRTQSSRFIHTIMYLDFFCGEDRLLSAFSRNLTVSEWFIAKCVSVSIYLNTTRAVLRVVFQVCNCFAVNRRVAIHCKQFPIKQRNVTDLHRQCKVLGKDKIVTGDMWYLQVWLLVDDIP